MLTVLERPPTAPLPLVGHIVALSRDPFTLLTTLAAEHGAVAPLHLGPLDGVLVSHPELVDEVLRKKAKHYTRRTRVYEALAKFLGRGILTSEGEHWRKHRRVVQPAFHRKRLAGFAGRIVALTDQALDRLRPGMELDVADAMMRLTLKIVSETLLGVRTDADADDIGRAIDDAQRYAEKLIGGMPEIPAFIPTPGNRRVRRAHATLDRVAYALIEEKRDAPGDDVISMLLEARTEDGAALPAQQIRDEVLTLLAAGHETTANALSWTLSLLSEHPASRRRLEEEVDAVLGDRAPTVDDLAELVFTRRVLDESLRLRPPAWATGRIALDTHAIEGETAGTHRIEEGTLILLSPWVTHRLPELWDNPEGFDPDRFSPERSEGRHNYAFYPFGGGPRKCVGEAFAYLEATLVLARLTQRFRLDLVPGHPVIPSPQVTLGLAEGLSMRVRAR